MKCLNVSTGSKPKCHKDHTAMNTAKDWCTQGHKKKKKIEFSTLFQKSQRAFSVFNKRITSDDYYIFHIF